MREIALTGRRGNGRTAKVADEHFEWLSQYNWHLSKSGYAESWRNKRRIKMHKLVHPLPDGMWVDHVNGNPLDNQPHNLRTATPADNKRNSRKQSTYDGKGCSSQFKGVTWYTNGAKWLAQIRYDGKRRHLGYFSTELDAARAYDAAAQHAYGEFARVNFPEGCTR